MSAIEPARVLALALDPDVQPPQDGASERILDAALALAAASGVRNLTVDDVAARAGVGRMTVYRRFGSKENLLDALFVRECRRGLVLLAATIDLAKPPADRLADGFVAALRLARVHPLLERLARVEREQLLALLEDGHVMALGRDFLAGQIRLGQRQGELRAVDPEAAGELLARIGVSFLLIPESVVDIEDDEQARAFARSLIAPVIAPARS